MGHFEQMYGQMEPTKLAYDPQGRPSALHLRRVELIVSPGQPSQRVLLFDQDVITVGSMDGNDLLIEDDTISRRHCRITQEGSDYILTDLGSTNGTFINGVRIREAFLTSGAMMLIGNTQVRFNPYNERITVKPSEDARYGSIVGQSLRMREIFGILEKIAPTSATVVIEGETGTGKEVVAQTAHKMSARANGPFVVFDCGAVPESLIESELFGHEKGAFTGAMMTRKGLFEMAEGGTIFLDELGELALELQPKLLRVLEQREVRRVGSNTPIPVNVRVVAATNRALEDEVAAGRFREDLFYRLSVVRLFLPPLRERKEDIALLVQHFLQTMRFNRVSFDLSDERLRIRTIEREAQEALARYAWPGNVRELVNVIERACSLAETDCIRMADLPEHISGIASMSSRMTPHHHGAADTAEDAWEELPSPGELRDKPFKKAKEEWISTFERDYITELLQRHNGNISQASREADIDRKYFRKLMGKYGIDPELAVDD